jgi:hypothetical protein
VNGRHPPAQFDKAKNWDLPEKNMNKKEVMTMADELLITLDSYSLQVLRKIVQVHIRHLDGQVKNVQKLSTRSESSLDADMYFLQVQLEDADWLKQLLEHPIRKENGWVKEIVSSQNFGAA